MFAEPTRTQADLNFTLFGFPVRVHPAFWILAVLVGPLESKPVAMALWVPAVFLSILVHELGHAVVMRWFGAWSHIVLYWIGGLAIPHGGFTRRPGTAGRIAISLAGPAAGFLLAAIVATVCIAAGIECHRVGVWPWLRVIPVIFWWDYPKLMEFLNNLLFVSVLWGLFNLLPIFPLDGGQAAEEFLAAVNPGDGRRLATVIALITAAGFAAYFLLEWLRAARGPGGVQPWGLFNVALFAYLAQMNYVRLQQYGRGRWF